MKNFRCTKKYADSPFFLAVSRMPHACGKNFLAPYVGLPSPEA